MSLFCTAPVYHRVKRSLITEWGDQLSSIGSAVNRYVQSNSTQRQRYHKDFALRQGRAIRKIRIPTEAEFRNSNLDPRFEFGPELRRRVLHSGNDFPLNRRQSGDDSPDYESRYGHLSISNCLLFIKKGSRINNYLVLST